MFVVPTIAYIDVGLSNRSTSNAAVTMTSNKKMGDGGDFSKVARREGLEKALLQRKLAPPEPPSHWEREMVRGYVYSFDKYKLTITNVSGLEEKIVIQEDSIMIATRVWDCAVLTTKWLEHKALSKNGNPHLDEILDPKIKLTKDRPIQVLELGAGTGLLSICLAKMGAAVLSTEYGSVVKYLEDNCRENNVLLDGSTGRNLSAGMVTCQELDWYKADATLESLFSAYEDAVFDIVIVTDCSLTENDSRGVVDMISKYSTKDHTKVIVGSCYEREGTPLLLELIKDFNNVQQVEQSEFHPDYTSSRHVILRCDA